ncbi:mRNA capping enzyme small subunit [Adoxophyes honmai entomopoxvirus 'L']|uniref:mRNA capping enzyme small subunit n=1 Tax=Adoxophyes honmai entomopoxvirus 'L' TaxID=1293540 RepID=A0A916P083_9POXV|nr:mRNA capping enzyme small subunit [Adoxophyes honmai entomopoxvirus 'L']CCU55411.1 mRNA capping enzyme small subunit [Adoxophyes honmai entomopoxvirus 'L']
MFDLTKQLIKTGINIKVPNVNCIQNLKIKYDNNSSPKAYFNIIYHLISIVIEIQDMWKFNDDNVNYFTKYDNFKKKTQVDYDYSYKNLFRSGFKSLEKSGSSMKNWTNIYNTTDVTLDIIYPLTKKHDEISIRLPCIISTAVIHYIYLLSYVYNSVTLIKEDLWLNDSFVVKCKNIKINNYDVVKNQLKNIQFNEKTRQFKIDSLFKNFMIDETFKNIIGKFISDIQYIICDLWLHIQKNINSSPSDRKKEYWEEYDKLLQL